MIFKQVCIKINNSVYVGEKESRVRRKDAFNFESLDNAKEYKALHTELKNVEIVSFDKNIVTLEDILALSPNINTPEYWAAKEAAKKERFKEAARKKRAAKEALLKAKE